MAKCSLSGKYAACRKCAHVALKQKAEDAGWEAGEAVYSKVDAEDRSLSRYSGSLDPPGKVQYETAHEQKYHPLNLHRHLT